MAPPPHYRRPMPKEKFASLFTTLKTQTYNDPSSRSAGTQSIRTLAWSPTGHLIATGTGDRTLRVWNPDKASVKNSTELRGHSSSIERVAWNPTKESELASCSSDGTVRLWDVRTKACAAEIKIGGEGLTLAWSPDGRTIVAGRKDDALIPITLSSTTPPVPLPPVPQSVQTNQIMFSHSGQELLLTTGTGDVKILSYPEFELLYSVPAHTSACYTLDMSPHGKHMVVGGSDALVSLWDTYEWVSKHILVATEGPVRSVGFSFDGSFVCVGSDEATGIDLAHVETGEYVHNIPTTHPSPCVAWHPHRYWLAYSGDPMGLKIVGAAGGSL